MPKNIVFCADGTWNGPGDADSKDIDGATSQDAKTRGNVTNVVNLFANLAGQVTPETQALHCETEKALLDSGGATEQISKYLHGVGDSSNPILKVLGGVLGVGVVARIVRGYTFISRNYAPGDAIHIVGFSRGAYTARALAGMIGSVGLLNSRTYDPADRTEAYRRGFEAWLKSKGVVFGGNDRLSSLLTAVTDFALDKFTRLVLKPDDLIANVPIKAVGVWDTVGAMGIPAYVKGGRRDFFSFVDLKLSPRVENGFHAMALDERRLDFPVTRWEPDPRIQQMWFVGAHSDVGGGYPAGESGLSDIALDWMMQRLAATGVRFSAPPIYVPNLTRVAQDFHTPWTEPPFNVAPQPRTPRAGDVFHPSVQEHWTACPPYQKAWPDQFKPVLSAG